MCVVLLSFDFRGTVLTIQLSFLFSRVSLKPVSKLRAYVHNEWLYERKFSGDELKMRGKIYIMMSASVSDKRHKTSLNTKTHFYF